MAKHTIIQARGDDWEGLYLDGKLWREGHSLRDDDIFALFAEIKTADVTRESYEVDYGWLHDEGSLPSDIRDVKWMDEGPKFTGADPETLRITQYVHCDKGDVAERVAEELGRPLGAEEYGQLRYALYEVGIDLEINTRTWTAEIVGVDGVPLQPTD